MALEEIIDVSCFPRKGYDNPVTFSIKQSVLEVSYQLDGIYKERHFLDENGKSKGYNIEILKRFPREVIYSFIEKELQERYQLDPLNYMKFREASNEARQNILQILLGKEGFRQEYNKIVNGYYEKFKSIVLTEEKQVAIDKIYPVFQCYKVIMGASSLIKDEQIKSYMNKAIVFDQRLFLPYIKS